MDPTTSSLITSIKTAIVPDSITPTLVGNTLERLADAIDRCATADSITTIANDADVVYIHDYDTQTAPEDIPGGDNNSNDHTAGWICYIAQANAFALRRWQAPYDYIGWLYPTGEETYGTYAQLALANGSCSVCRPYKRKLYMARTTNWGITANTFAPVLLYSRDNDAPLSPVLPPLATTAANGLMSKEDKLKLDGYTTGFSNNQVATLTTNGLMSKEDKAAMATIPTAQTTSSSTASDHKYIYSTTQGSTAVLSAGKFNFQYSNNGSLTLQLGAWDPTNAAGSKFTKSVTLPTATSSAVGLMSATDKTKLDGYPEARTATESNWGLMGADHARKLATCWPNVYGRHEGVKRAVNGIFSLPSNATVAQIEAALTEYTTKAVLTPLELENCAANGMMLYDEATQGFVTVTHNGGGIFNFIELSAANYGQLPQLRFCSLLLTADTKQVKRSGQEERICFKSELDNVQSQLNNLLQTLRDNGTI